MALNILQTRLERLVEHGIVGKKAYQVPPVRYEYRLTTKGAELWPVLMALLKWGDKYAIDGERPVIVEHRRCGESWTTAGAASVAVRTCRSPRSRRSARAPGAQRRRRPFRPERASGRAATVSAMRDDTTWLDATDQAALVRNGSVSPSELVDEAIARIERLNPALNAVIYELFDRARAAAAGTLPDGPFKGVPLLLKDLGAELAGTPFNEGTAFAGDYHSTVDQELTTRFLAAGFVVCGKTNTPEFGILPTTEPKRFGASRNPWNTAHSTGGSSGGSAAAVASGMVAVAHANDGGGSIRIPASCCGLVGLKPTVARVSTAPQYGDLMGGLVAEHVVTRRYAIPPPFSTPSPARSPVIPTGRRRGAARRSPLPSGRSRRGCGSPS